MTRLAVSPCGPGRGAWAWMCPWHCIMALQGDKPGRAVWLRAAILIHHPGVGRGRDAAGEGCLGLLPQGLLWTFLQCHAEGCCLLSAAPVFQQDLWPRQHREGL